MVPAHPKNAPPALRRGQAIALQAAIQVLIRVNRQPRLVRYLISGTTVDGGVPAETTALGCGYLARIMQPFMVEVALKALIGEQSGGQAPSTHNLAELHQALLLESRKALDVEFERVKRELHLDEARSLAEVLADHRTDFPNWRYLDAAESLHADPFEVLQLVAGVILTMLAGTKCGDT